MCAILASWLATTSINRLHDADSVLFQLNSRHHWTPYFWEQDRVGMIWSLLTKPITHPLANLFVQNGIMIFCGLAYPFILLRVLDRYAAIHVGILNMMWMLGVGTNIIHDNLYIVCLYPTALFLGGCGLLALEPNPGKPLPLSRIAISLMLLILAHWVYIAVIFIMMPLAFLRLWCQTNRRKVDWLSVGWVGLSFLVGLYVMVWVRGRYPGIDVTPTEFNSIGTIPMHLFDFLAHLVRDPVGWFWIVGTVSFAIYGIIIRHRKDYFVAAHTRTFISLIGVGCLELVVMSSLKWPCLMDHHPRYLLGFLGLLGIAAFSTWPFFYFRPIFDFLIESNAITKMRYIVRSPWYYVVSVFAIACLRYGMPDVQAVRADFDQRFGKHTEAILASGAQSIGDEYWPLWPAVFHLELVRYERGLPPMDNAVGLRSCAYWESWQAAGSDGFLVAIPKPIDPNVIPASEARGLASFEFVREDESLAIYRTRIVFRPFPGKPSP